MTKKKLAILFGAMLFSTLLTALMFELITRKQGPLLPPESVSAEMRYIFGIVCVACTILGLFLSLRQQAWNPLFRMTMLVVPALLVIIDYYLLGDINYLFCLPMLAVAYLMIFYKMMQD